MNQLSFTPVYILALNLSSETNEHIMLKTHGISKFKQVSGVYTHDNGEKVKERSYIVPAHHSPAVFEIAKQTNQESVLHLGPESNRPATLIYTDTKERKLLGDFVAVSKVTAEALPAYTYDASSNTYYAAK